MNNVTWSTKKRDTYKILSLLPIRTTTMSFFPHKPVYIWKSDPWHYPALISKIHG